MNSLLEQLHDIEELDSIPWWPLAIGWWIVIGMAAALLISGIVFAFYWIAFKRSWRSDALQKLAELEKRLSESTSRESVIALSEIFRRIVLRRFKRQECASLIEEAWLKWLSEHDPKQFDWEKKGIALIKIPYAPHDATVPVHEVVDLIQAIKHWVR